jgi:hydrogenase maturation protease
VAEVSPAGSSPARTRAHPAVVVIGVGNWLRHDDAAGLEIAQRLRSRANAAGIAVREHEGETLGLLEQWDGVDGVILVDATHSGAPAGTIHRVDASSQPIPAGLSSSSSTHAVGVGEAIELARSLGRLPRRVVLYGVEGCRFDAGSGISGEVQAVIAALADTVLREARELAGAGETPVG